MTISKLNRTRQGWVTSAPCSITWDSLEHSRWPRICLERWCSLQTEAPLFSTWPPSPAVQPGLFFPGGWAVLLQKWKLQVFLRIRLASHRSHFGCLMALVKASHRASSDSRAWGIDSTSISMGRGACTHTQAWGKISAVVFTIYHNHTAIHYIRS